MTAHRVTGADPREGIGIDPLIREIIEAWRADLSTRLRRHHLRYEAAGDNREAIIDLTDEVRAFKETVAWINGEFAP